MVWSRGTGGMGDKTREEVFKKLNHALSLLQQKLSKIAHFCCVQSSLQRCSPSFSFSFSNTILSFSKSLSSTSSHHRPLVVLPLPKVLFLYKQVGTEGGMYKAIYKQFIKKVIIVQDKL